MEYQGLPDIRTQVELWNQLAILRQNSLLNESSFLSFAQDRGIPVVGVVEGEPGQFVNRGWLGRDDCEEDGSHLFHPFRIFAIYRILEACDLRIARCASLRADSYLRLTKRCLGEIPTDDEFRKLGAEWNRVVDLAVLLEPVYWPRIVEKQRSPLVIDEKQLRKLQGDFRAQTLEFVKTLDPHKWRRVHECLRLDAWRLDKNAYLYILLRVADWHERQALKGPLSGALWLRHMAEVIRRGFEEAFAESWPEEYGHGGDHWYPGAKQRIFATERPLDNAIRTKPSVAHKFGLFTGSSVRWYVEGDTEYFAFLEALSEPEVFGIELVNLKGEIVNNQSNAAMKFEHMLADDRRSRRFSMVSIDRDVQQNERFLRRQIQEDSLVGLISLHEPDFEFANFSRQELVEIAARMDDSKEGFSGDAVREKRSECAATTARELDSWYKSVSARSPANLKCGDWGRELARFSRNHPFREDGSERPMVNQVRAATFGWSVGYRSHYKYYTFDPETFALIERPQMVKRDP